MKKDKFNSKLREFARSLSPSTSEQNLVNKIYQSFNDLFGIDNCIQIGSYPRFTSITPIHDLDILYILGQWSENSHDPSETLKKLFSQINSDYVNPTSLTVSSSLQAHSVTVIYSKDDEEVFSVDIVPAYSYGKNEFQQDTYMVPEILKEKNHDFRKSMTWDSNNIHDWIKSDPRGYIKVATLVGQNQDFRKVVKLVKKWKNNLNDFDEKLKLKSFHLEQVITKLFQQFSDTCVFDAIFKFFVDLPDIINNPNQIKDRANGDKFIDDYLEKFTPEQKEKIKQVRDYFLIKLENLDEKDSIDFLLTVNLHKRKSLAEEYLFDKKIPTFTDPQYSQFSISADITDKAGNTQRPLNNQGVIDSGRYLKFKRLHRIDGCTYNWKVKNDDNCTEPRGEITCDQTRNVPESTKYKGRHYAECYAIKDGVCVARAKQSVVLL